MKKIAGYIILICIAFGVIFVIPSIILFNMQSIHDTAYETYVDKWLAFGGSYWGGILGGICTLAGVVVTLKVSQAESMKPLLVTNFVEREILIRDPEDYFQVNSLKGVMNYASIPLISDLYKIAILNVGKGNAKDIDITMLIKRSDAFLTDNNLKYLNMNRLPDEQVKLVNDNYVQKEHITFISQEGGKCSLPINIAMNGIIFSSIWNIVHVTSFDNNDFLNNIDGYYKKIGTLPMTIPEIFILFEYSDLNDKRYHSLFRLGFSIVAHQLGHGVIIKPRLYYEKDSKSVKFKRKVRERKQKVDRISFKEKCRIHKLEIWQGYKFETKR